MTGRRPAKPVTERALLQRINRILVKREQAVRISRTERLRAQLGTYYRARLGNRRIVLQANVDLAELGRELGAIRGEEFVVLRRAQAEGEKGKR
jgi:hypothetical protein